uniref:Peptidase M16 C-terminal domain-containing protein n=1 Tax=Kalanchoe fedtschenkoi TaxID=63787 RepID=A0A7N0T097_KALFE
MSRPNQKPNLRLDGRETVSRQGSQTVPPPMAPILLRLARGKLVSSKTGGRAHFVESILRTPSAHSWWHRRTTPPHFSTLNFSSSSAPRCAPPPHLDDIIRDLLPADPGLIELVKRAEPLLPSVPDALDLLRHSEFICMEFRFTLRDNGMRAAFQLLHMVLEHSVWLEDAFDRAKQLYLSYYRSIPKSLERSTAHKLMLAMLNGDERFVEPTPESLQSLTLHTVKEAVMNQFVGGNMEMSIVGDFSEEDIENCILDYLGTVNTTKATKTALTSTPFAYRQSPSDLQFQQVFLNDTDERACAYIAGPAPNRWGFTAEGEDLFKSFNTVSDEESRLEESSLETRGDCHSQMKLRDHPLFFGITMGLLAEIINSRLFTTVRDSLGLTYDVSFEVSLFDRLNLGWYVITVTSTPAKVYKAVDACKNVLRGLDNSKIAQRELDRARRTLLMRHEAEIKSNAYWLGGKNTRHDPHKQKAWKAVEIAMACVSPTSIKRPTMNEVVIELNQCLKMEKARKTEGYTDETMDSIDMVSLNKLRPLAR